MDDKKMKLLVELENLEQILNIFEEFFSMDQNIQSESVVKVLKILVNGLKEDIWELIGKDCI